MFSLQPRAVAKVTLWKPLALTTYRHTHRHINYTQTHPYTDAYMDRHRHVNTQGNTNEHTKTGKLYTLTQTYAYTYHYMSHTIQRCRNTQKYKWMPRETYNYTHSKIQTHSMDT